MTIPGFFETRAKAKKPKVPKTLRPAGAAGTRRSKVLIDYSSIRAAGCDGCALYSETLESPKMAPTGSKCPVLYVLGEAPGATEDAEGKQFVGSIGRVLRSAMSAAGLDDYPIRWNNCCRCRPPKNRTPNAEDIEHCRNSVLADIEATKPFIVLGVGATALAWALGETNITLWRGRFVPVKFGDCVCWFYPIYHPAYLQYSDKDQGFAAAFSRDLRLLREWLEHEDTMNVAPPLERIEHLYDGVHCVEDPKDYNGLFRQLASWTKNKTTVAIDIETKGVRPYSFKRPVEAWLSIAISDGTTTWAVPISHGGLLRSPDEHEQLLLVLENFLRGPCRKLAHNLSFELEWLSSIYGHEKSWSTAKLGDTMRQAYILDERRGGLGLDMLCMQYFGFRLKRQSDVDLTNLAALPLSKLLRYNALDAKYTLRLYKAQLQALRRSGLLSVYQFQLRRGLALVKAQQMGLSVDFQKVEQYKVDIQEQLAATRVKIALTKEAKLFKESTGFELSPTSPKQLATLFQTLLKRPEGETDRTKSGYSVDDSVLSSIRLPIAKHILEFRRSSKLKSTYLENFGPQGGVVFPDGKLHTKYNDTFAATGRLSSDGPNLQNFPKRKDAWIRRIVVPPKGYVFLSVDYGQIEYRVLGVASGDAYVKQTLRDRYDIHRDWAERVARAEPRVWRAFGKDIGKLRAEIKNTWVFPAFYGAHAAYIARLLNMRTQACFDLFDEFWDEFRGVRQWQNRTLKFFDKYGFVECLTGRRRHAPLTKNMVYNTPIQGSASDIVVDAMTRLSTLAETMDEPALQPPLNIHDDLTFCVPKRRKEELEAIIVREMLTPSFDWVDVPLSVEVSSGSDWGTLTKGRTYFSDDKEFLNG